VHRQPGQLVLAQRPHHRLVARVRQHQVERRQVDPFARDDRRTRSSGLGYCRASRYRTALSSTPSYRAIPRLLIPRSYNTPIVTTSPPSQPALRPQREVRKSGCLLIPPVSRPLTLARIVWAVWRNQQPFRRGAAPITSLALEVVVSDWRPARLSIMARRLQAEPSTPEAGDTTAVRTSAPELDHRRTASLKEDSRYGLLDGSLPQPRK
jgi:hypothetical protein